MTRYTDPFETVSEMPTHSTIPVPSDLRTPLRGILAYAEHMRSGRAGTVSAAHRGYLSDIIASAYNALDMVGAGDGLQRPDDVL
jgi:hypothetical protein